MKIRQYKLLSLVIVSMVFCGFFGNRLIFELRKPMYNLNIQQYLTDIITSNKLESMPSLSEVKSKLNESPLENTKYHISEILSVHRVGSDLEIRLLTDKKVTQIYRYKVSQKFVAFIRDEQ
jgi:hypothetical protein